MLRRESNGTTEMLFYVCSLLFYKQIYRWGLWWIRDFMICLRAARSLRRSRMWKAWKMAVGHVDLIGGLSSREIAVDFIKNNTEADGIISTKPALIRRGKELSLFTVMRYSPDWCRILSWRYAGHPEYRSLQEGWSQIRSLWWPLSQPELSRYLLQTRMSGWCSD